MSESASKSSRSLGQTVIAGLILLVAAWVLLHFVIHLVVFVATIVAVVLAVIALIWAVRVLL
jgi:sugar phosphate permease